MKRASRHKKDMIRAYESMPRVDRSALDNRQDIALHALAADIGSVTRFPPRDLVNLIQENDAAALHSFECNARHLIHIDQLLLFLLQQIFEAFRHAHFALARALTK